MNLKIGVEEADGWFIGVIIAIIILGTLVIAGTLAFFERSKHKYRAKCERFGENKFFDSIDKDVYIMSLCAEMSDGTLPLSVCQTIQHDLNTPRNLLRNTDGLRRNVTPTSLEHAVRLTGRTNRSPARSPVRAQGALSVGP